MATNMPTGGKATEGDFMSALTKLIGTNTPKSETKTFKWNIDISGVKDLQEANDQIERFNKLNKQNKSNYFIAGKTADAQAVAIERITNAYKEYNEAVSESAKKATRGNLVRQTNAYMARSDFDQTKLPQQIISAAKEAERILNGSTGKAFQHFSVDTFKSLFDEMQKMFANGLNPKDFTNTIVDSTTAAVEKARAEVKKQTKNKPIISNEEIFNSEWTEQRVKHLSDKLEEFYKKLYDADGNPKNKSFSKRQGEQFVQYYAELESYLSGMEKEMPKRFQDIHDNINNFVLFKGDEELIDVNRIYQEAYSKFDKKIQAIENKMKREAGKARRIAKELAEDGVAPQETDTNTQHTHTQTHTRTRNTADGGTSTTSSTDTTTTGKSKSEGQQIPGVGKSIEEQNQLQAELDETKNSAKQTADAIDEINKPSTGNSAGQKIADDMKKATEEAEKTKEAVEGAVKATEESKTQTQDKKKKGTFSIWKQDEKEQPKQKQKTTEELYRENRNPYKKAGNIKQLEEQYHWLRNINHDIQEWEHKNATGSFTEELKIPQANLEDLKQWRKEILELNPQLELVAENSKRIDMDRFKRIFGDSFKDNIDDATRLEHMLENLKEAYQQVKSLESAVNDGHDDAKFQARLQDQKKLFAGLYEMYQKMSGNKLDIDIPGKENLTDLREYYNTLTGKALEQTQDIGGSVELKEYVRTLLEFDSTLDHVMGQERNQTQGKQFFDYLIQNGTEAQKILFRVDEGFKQFQSVLRGLSVKGAVDYSSALGLDTLDLKLKEMREFLGESEDVTRLFMDNTSFDPKEKLSKAKEFIKALQDEKKFDTKYNEAIEAARYEDDEKKADQLEDEANDYLEKAGAAGAKVNEFKEEYQGLMVILKDGTKIIADATNFDQVLSGIDVKDIKEASLQFNELYDAFYKYDKLANTFDYASPIKDHDSMLYILDDAKSADYFKERYNMNEEEAEKLFKKVQYLQQNLFDENDGLNLSQEVVNVYNEVADEIQNRYVELAASVSDAFKTLSDVVQKEGRNLTDFIEHPDSDQKMYDDAINGKNAYHIEVPSKPQETPAAEAANNLRDELKKTEEQAASTYEAVEKIMRMTWNNGRGGMTVDLEKLLPVNQEDLKRLLGVVNLSMDDEQKNKNLKILNDYIEDRKKQLQRYLKRDEEGSGWDPKHNKFDEVVENNYSKLTNKQAEAMLQRYRGYSRVFFEELTKDINVEDELKPLRKDLFDKVKSGAMDAMQAVTLLNKEIDDLWQRRIRGEDKNQPDETKPKEEAPIDNTKSKYTHEQLVKINDDLELMADKSREVMKQVGEILGSGEVSQSETEQYYQNALNDLDALDEKSKEIRQSLSEIMIPDDHDTFNNRKAGILNLLNAADQAIAGRKKDVQDIYQSIDFEAQKKAQEEEARISSRIADITKRITGNADYKYAEDSWLQEYIERAKTSVDEIDAIYADFETRLAERKQGILDQEQKDAKIQENKGQFISFLRSVSPSGVEEFEANRQKYSSLIDGITDDINTLDDAINKVKEDMASVGSGIEDFKNAWTKSVLKSTEAPEELSREYMACIKEINAGTMDVETGFQRMNDKAKELGVTFDDVTGKWQKVVSGDDTAISDEITDFDRLINLLNKYKGLEGLENIETRYSKLIQQVKDGEKSYYEAAQHLSEKLGGYPETAQIGQQRLDYIKTLDFSSIESIDKQIEIIDEEINSLSPTFETVSNRIGELTGRGLNGIREYMSEIKSAFKGGDFEKAAALFEKLKIEFPKSKMSLDDLGNDFKRNYKKYLLQADNALSDLRNSQAFGRSLILQGVKGELLSRKSRIEFEQREEEDRRQSEQNLIDKSSQNLSGIDLSSIEARKNAIEELNKRIIDAKNTYDDLRNQIDDYIDNSDRDKFDALASKFGLTEEDFQNQAKGFMKLKKELGKMDDEIAGMTSARDAILSIDDKSKVTDVSKKILSKIGFDTSSVKNQVAANEEEEETVDSLIAKYEKLGEQIKKAGSEKEEMELIYERTRVNKKLLDAGMFYEGDSDKWVPDEINLINKLQDLLHLTTKGDIDGINEMFQIEAKDMNDVTTYTRNLQLLISTLQSASIDPTKFSRSMFEGNFMSDLLDPDTTIGGGLRAMNIDEKIVRGFVDSVMKRSDTSSTDAQTKANEEEAKSANEAAEAEERKKEAASGSSDTSSTDAQTKANEEEAKSANEAAEAEERKKKAALAPPPKPPGGNNNPPGRPPGGPPGGPNGPGGKGGSGGGGGGGGNPPKPPKPPKPSPTKDSKIIGTTFKDDGSYEKRYLMSDGRILSKGKRFIGQDNAGQDLYEDFEREVTNYQKLEKDAINITNQLTDANLALAEAQRQGLGGTQLESAIQSRITLLNSELVELQKLADAYETGPDYDGSTPEYSRKLFDQRVKKETDLYAAKAAQKDAKKQVSEWISQQNKIDSATAFLTKQGGLMDRLENRYLGQKNPVKLSKSDINELNRLRYGEKNGIIGSATNVFGGIQGWINQRITGTTGTANTQLSQSDRQDLIQMIENYKQTAKLAEESQKVASKLAAKTPAEARASLNREINSLVRDMENSKADVSNLLNEIISLQEKFEIEQEKLKQDKLNGTNTSQADKKEWLRSMHSEMNVIKSNYQDKEDEYKTNQVAYKDQLSVIKELNDAKSEMNRITANKIAGKNVSNEAEAMQNLTNKTKEAGQAVFELFQMLREGKITKEQAYAARDMYYKAKDYGSTSSQNAIIRALNQRRSRETKTEITDYGKAYDTYEELKQKELSGGKLSADEMQKMSDALQTILLTEEKWNAAKTDGINLTSRQRQLVEQLDDAQAKFSNANGQYNASNRKSMLDEIAMQSKLSDEYDSIQAKIAKMYNQKDWRAPGFEGKIKELETELESFDPFSVTDKAGFDQMMQNFTDLKAKIQEVQKSTEWREVGRDWQAKQENNLAKWMDQNKIAAKAYADELENLRDRIKDVGNESDAEQWVSDLNKLQARAADEGLLGKSLGDRFKDQFKNTMTSLATYYLSFQDFIRYGREAIQTVTELDTQLTEMRKVSDESLSTLQNYQLETFDIADRVGTTAAQISASTADWMRLGEELSEAKKSAEYSTVLMNVSEFTDINAATEALVAMSQAYQDLDKGTIIDKINNIGNNFSISTSELAESLQRSAGTLKVAGNSLDEAIALTVAGNQVLQNPLMVGQSLRTISLRLTGTSVKDMQEAGEEIDGLITTQSKLRSTIMDVTKVQKNGYKGFDILDDNGNYKTTYEMLKGIAEVWKEIGEEDKRMGTNRQSFLLETIAGKTRAAAASSILDNFEVLQDVYESALNSEGSAQKELDKYLDSIQGKAARFKNALQELTASAIDSSWIKGFIDLGTGLLKVIDDLGSSFGHLNTLIGAGLGVFLQANGKGLLGFDKKSGKFSSGMLQMAVNIKEGIVKAFTKQSFGNDILDSMFSGIDKSDRIYNIVAKNSNIALPQNFVNWFNGLDDATKKTTTLGDALNSVGKSAFSLSNAFSALGSIGTTVLSTLGTMALTMAAAWAVSEIVKGIYEIVNAENIAIQRGQEAISKIKDIDNEYNNKKDYANQNIEEYLKLREGIQITENGGVQNVSLSTEEYERFISINKELASLFPSLVTKYDSQGNALLSLSSDANEATQSLSSLLEQERLIADFQVGDNLSDATTGFATRYKQLQTDIQNQQNIIDAGQELQSVIQSAKENDQFDLSKLGVNLAGRELKFEYDVNDQAQADFVTKIQNAFTEAAHDYGGVSWNASDSQVGLLSGALMGVTDEQASEIGERFIETLSKFELSDIPETIIDAMSLQNADYSEIKADWNGLVPSVLSQLNLYEQYQKLGDAKFGDQLQQIMASDISNLRFDEFTQDDWNLFGNNPRQFVREKFLDPIINAVSDEEGNIQEDIVKQIIDVISNTDMSRNEWRDAIMRMSSDLFDGNQAMAANFRVAIGVQYETKDGKLVWSDGDNISDLSQITGISQDVLNSQLSKEDLDLAINAKLIGKFDFEGASLEELQQWIDEYKAKQEEVKEVALEGTLEELFNDETYSSSAEDYEKNLSSLTTALQTLRSEGKLTEEAQRDLFEQFSSLAVEAGKNGGVLTEAMISDKAKDELDKWIKDIRTGIEQMTPDEKAGANRYIESLITSWGQVADSIDDVIELYDSLVDAQIQGNDKLSREERDFQKQQFDDQISSLENQLAAEGEEIDYNVVYMMIAKDEFSGTAEEIKQKYDNTKITYDIEINNAKAKADIEKNLANISSHRNRAESEKSYKETLGISLRPDDFSEILSIDDEDIREYKKALDIANKEFDDAERDYFNSSSSTEDSLYKILQTKKAARDEAIANLTGAKSTKEGHRQEQIESGVNEYNARLDAIKNRIDQYQNIIDRAEENGTHASKAAYESMAEQYQAQTEIQKAVSQYWTNQAAIAENEETRSKYLAKANEANTAMLDAQKAAHETKMQPRINALNDYQNAYSALQSEATSVENEISMAEAKHQKISSKMYEDLIKNGNKQIQNLYNQKANLIALRNQTTVNTDAWRDYQSQIEGVDQSIGSMQQNQIGWFETMTSLVSSNASELASVLSSAFSEINSGTGLTIDTMNALQRQFSDLAGYDVSSIFYQSADGMKMNVDAAEALVHAEYEVEQANLHEIISTNEKILADQNATQSAREQAEARIQAAQRELSMLQALYDQQKQQFSDFQQWQNAESTANAGDRYKTIQSAIKDMKEARKKGLTGTDEFRSFTKMIDEYGLDTVAAFDRSIAKVERYFTEDASGLGKFFADAVAKGYGTGSAAEGYTLAIPDVDEFSDALDITREMTDILLGRAEDYGVYNDWVETVTDGELKLAEVMEQSADAQLKMNQLRREGASQDVIDNQQEVIDRLDNRKANIEAGIAALSERENYVTAEELRNGIADFKSLRHMLYNDEIDESTFKRRAQQLADDTHIKLTPDLMQVDESEMQKAFPDYNEVKVTPILAENANVLGVDETGEESFDNILGLLKSAYNETEGWDEEVGSVLSSLEGYTGEDFDKIIFGDGTYQNQELESALDSLLAKLGLGQEQGEALVSVLKKVFGIDYTEQKYSLGQKSTQTGQYSDTAQGINSIQTRSAMEEEIAFTAQNAEKQRLLELNTETQQPTIDAVDAAKSDIVSAIESLPEGIATALNNWRNSKEPESPTTLNTQERLAQSVANNYPSQSISSDISEEKLQLAATTQVKLSGVENIGNNLEPDEKIKITIPVDDVNADVSGANFDINKDNQQSPLVIDAANVSDNMVSDSLSSLSDMRRTIVEAQVQKERELMREALEQTSAESTSEIHDGVVGQIQHVADDIKESGEKIDIKIPLSNILVSFVDDSAITSDDGFGSMLSDQIQHMADGVAGSVPLENSGEAKEVQINYTGNQGEMNAVVSQDVASGQMTADGNPIEPQYESGNGLVNMVVDAITSASFVAEKNPIEINFTGGESATAEPQAAPVVTPQVDNAEYDSAMSSAIKSADELDSKKPTPKAGLDTGGFDSGANHVESKMSHIEELTSTPTIDVNVSPAMSNLEALQQKAAQTAAALASVGSGGGGGTNKVVPQYTGTMLSPAHASGTAYNMLNMRNITDAFANGKVDLAHDEEALVNELGTESIVRDGKWFLIPGGMHVEALKKGDIVLNHLQTADLIQHGKAFGRGKAFAQGSGVNLADLHPVASAHGGTNPYTTVGTFTPWADDTIPKAAANAQNANTNATKANTAAKDKETKATENTTTALEKFQNWASSFMDWIEVRINRFTQRMELNLSKMENAVGFSTKNNYVDQAIADNNVVLETSQKAIGKNGGYTKHLKKVVSKAKSAKLVTEKEAKRLIGLIEEGGLTVEDFSKYLKNKKNKNGSDSSKTENRATAFIDEYQKWYEKILGCRDGIEQCIAKQKELQQTKLDNIKEEYESLTTYIEALNASSQATISLHESLGYDERYGTEQGNQTRQQYQAQINNQRGISTTIWNEMLAFQAEMENAASVFGVDSIQYRQAQTDYENMSKAFAESQQNVKDLTRTLYDLNLKPMEYGLNRLKAAAQSLADTVSLFKARGTMKNNPSTILTEDKYTDQIKLDNGQIAQLTQRIEYNKRIQQDLDYATNSAKWDELQKSIEADESAIKQLEIANEGLKDSIRELRWKEFDDLQKKVTNAISDFDHLRGLFNEEEFFDDDGEGWNLTKEGKANIALLGAQIMETRNQIADYREALNKVNEEYDHGVISQEEYEEYSRNMVETIQKLVDNTENYKDALIDLYKTQITNENEALQKNIKLRQDALSKQREYYEYSKKLTDQQKDRNKIVAQINALQGNANLSARAQVARLREQLAEAEEGLDSTRRDHRYDLLNEGYSKLSEDAQESLDKTLRHVAANAQQQEQIVEMMLSKVKGNYDEAYGTIQQRISDTGTVVSQTADQCMRDGTLQTFFDNLDSKTITPKNNWDQFVNAATQRIDTSAIDEFVTHLGEKLSDAKRIAQETAKALADAAKQQSSSGSTQGSADNISNNNSNNSNNSSNNNNNTNTGLQQDKVVQILKTLKKGKSKTGGDVGDWIEKTFGLSTTSGIPTQLASALGINVSKKWAKGDSDKVLKALKAHLKKLKITDLKTLKAFKGYKRGTLGTLEDELAFTHEGEIIRRPDGAILRQLPAGTQVIPKVDSENLLKWAQIDPFKELKEGFKGFNQITNTNNNAPVYYYDSIIHIDGNVDADMMDRVEQLGKALLSSGNFQKGVVQKVTQEYKREFNKRY